MMRGALAVARKIHRRWYTAVGAHSLMDYRQALCSKNFISFPLSLGFFREVAVYTLAPSEEYPGLYLGFFGEVVVYTHASRAYVCECVRCVLDSCFMPA